MLFVVDRSIYLFAPALHVFTYQTMAHDLLPIKAGGKVTYVVKVTTSCTNILCIITSLNLGFRGGWVSRVGALLSTEPVAY